MKVTVPSHVAIILNGNRRWARLRGLPASAGHFRGLYQTLWPVVREADQRGVRWLTVYGFSKENWKRAPAEVDYLMKLFERGLKNRANRLVAAGIRLRAVGELDRLPPRLQAILADTIARTADNPGLTLTLALSYGGRADIAQAAERLRGRGPLTEQTFGAALTTAELPDVDLLIRTSGEQRLSGFLPWQVAYAELYFTETLWPDFRPADLAVALADYAGRRRRFGS